MTSIVPSQNSLASLKALLIRYRFLLLIIVGVWLIFFLLPGMRTLPLLEPDEGRNAEVAREMLRGGDWVTPHYNGYPYLDKPAPFFWLVAASFKVFNVSEWAARLPSGLAALATMLLVWVLARRMFGPEEAVISALALAASPLFLVFAQEVIFDMTLTFLVIAALVCFWWDEQRPERRIKLDLLMFAAMGLATITKGPVGFLLPVLGILVYSLARGGLERFKRVHWGWGAIAFFAAALPWFIAVSARNPDFPRYAFWQESLVRFTTGSARRSGSWLYYLPVYLGGFFPWSLALLFACFPRLKKMKELRDERNAPVAFLAAFVVVVFVLFTISRSKLPGYFLPALGPLSILLARLWTTSRARDTGKMPDWLTASFASLIGAGVLFLLVPRLEYVHFVHVRLEKKMPSDLIGLVNASMIFSGVLLAALGILGRNFAARARPRVPSNILFAFLALAAPLMFLQWTRPLKSYADYASSRSLAEEILASPEKLLPVYGYYYFRTGLPFYLRRPVGLVTTGAEEMTSNYVVSRWPKILPHLKRAGFAPQVSAPGEEGLPGPLVFEKDWIAQTRSWDCLVFLRNGMVPDLFKTRERVNPLWTFRDFSVWQIPASGSVKGPSK